MIKLITLLVLMATPVFANDLSSVKELVDSEVPFDMFPEEKNGRLEYLDSSVEGCQFSFRDSVGMRKSNGHFTYWIHTRSFNVQDLTYIEWDERSAGPHYYMVIFGTGFRTPIKVLQPQTVDETGTKHHQDYTTFDSFMRFQSEKAAREALAALKSAHGQCKNSDVN